MAGRNYANLIIASWRGGAEEALTSLMWLGVVSSMCHAPSLVVP